MLDKITEILVTIDDYVWNVPLIVLILSVGVYLTVRMRGLQFTKLGKAVKLIGKKDSAGAGEVSGFGALCTALSATIGTGNIVGVATAIVAGGPGALFWMWMAALLGTCTKFAECMLAVKYRQVDSEGHVLGGPFYYIEKGMGPKFKWLAKIFAVFGIGVGLFGIGTFTQVNGISNAVKGFFDADNEHMVNILGRDYSWAVVITGIIVTVCAALVIIGGIQRISKVAEVVVPFMAILYVVFAVVTIGCNITKIPAAFSEIFQGAFGIRAISGGVIGTIIVSMRNGIARGIFSNEAGLGSAPIAAAAAQTEEPVEQGLISMLGTVIDTLIICTLTGLTIVITGAWDMGLEGVAVTTKAYQMGLPFPSEVASFILMICLVFFAFTTILGWDYYSEKCLEYLSGGKKGVVMTYRWMYILAVFIGPYMTVSAVWTIADIFNGLMALPNLVALVALSGVVSAEVKDYVARNKKAK